MHHHQDKQYMAFIGLALHTGTAQWFRRECNSLLHSAEHMLKVRGHDLSRAVDAMGQRSARRELNTVVKLTFFAYRTHRSQFLYWRCGRFECTTVTSIALARRIMIHIRIAYICNRMYHGVRGMSQCGDCVLYAYACQRRDINLNRRPCSLFI